MNERNAKLVEAAQSVFARYGVGKTTMNDIAREAGVARQTLYNTYPSKEAVLRAAVRHAANQTLEAVDAAWRDMTTLSDKLDIFFELGPLNWYDVIQTSPDVAELIDGIHTIANDELNEVAKLWNARFEILVREHASADILENSSPADIADYIYSASSNAKYNAADRGTLETRLKILKMSLVGLIET